MTALPGDFIKCNRMISGFGTVIAVKQRGEKKNISVCCSLETNKVTLMMDGSAIFEADAEEFFKDMVGLRSSYVHHQEANKQSK